MTFWPAAAPRAMLYEKKRHGLKCKCWVASVDNSRPMFLQPTLVSYCPCVRCISRVRVKCFWVKFSVKWNDFLNCWQTLFVSLLLLCSGSRAVHHSVPTGNSLSTAAGYLLNSHIVMIYGSSNISLYFNTISSFIWLRVKRGTAVRRYSRLTNTVVLHFCCLYNRPACLDPQGDRGRDGFEGQKGEPVSRWTSNFSSSTASSATYLLI